VHIVLPQATAGSFTWFDGLAVVLLVLFAWHGYRRGLLYFVAGLGATLLSLTLSFLLAPFVPALLPPTHSLDAVIEQRIAFAVLLIASRLILGLVFRELILALRPVLHVLPPLRFADHLLGVVPSLAMGSLLILALLLLGIVLPLGRGIHDAAAGSYVHRAVVGEISAAMRLLPKSGLLGDPGRLVAAVRQLPSSGQAAANW